MVFYPTLYLENSRLCGNLNRSQSSGYRSYDSGSCFQFAFLNSLLSQQLENSLDTCISLCQEYNRFPPKMPACQCILQHFNSRAYVIRHTHKIPSAKNCLPHHNYLLQRITYIFVIIQMFLYREFYIVNGKLYLHKSHGKLAGLR